MSFQNLQLETRDGVAHLTLDRPKAANALDLALATELAEAALRCDEDPSVRCVLLRGRGKIFCAGGDLASFRNAEDAVPTLLKKITSELHLALSRFARMRAPVLAAVGGSAAGAGMSLACAADLLLAGESARFSMAYTRVGLTPDGSSTYYLPRLIGRRRTLELMLLNRSLKASEALQWGLVNQVVADDQLDGEAEALARMLAEGPTAAFGSVKRLLLASEGHGFEAQLELEGRGIADAARSADAKEGMAAFFEKRNARFTGS